MGVRIIAADGFCGGVMGGRGVGDGGLVRGGEGWEMVGKWREEEGKLKGGGSGALAHYCVYSNVWAKRFFSPNFPSHPFRPTGSNSPDLDAFSTR